jgi:hypothetical protein
MAQGVGPKFKLQYCKKEKEFQSLQGQIATEKQL